MTATAASPLQPEPYDFSLVLGGPVYQLFRSTWLSGDVLELLNRRVAALCAIAWLPLLVLAALEGNAWPSALKLPFLYDVELHVRLLVALPLLVVAELVVHVRMRPVVRQFVERDLVPEHARAQFDAAIASMLRLRNSVAVELLLIAFVYGVGVRLLWRNYIALDVPSWYGVVLDGWLQPSWAGWWFGCVSLPLVQFLILRWYFRLFLWARFLWHLSRIDLNLVATHPDRTAGLGFLAQTSYAFTPFLMAQSTLLAGMIANHIFFAGKRLPDFKVEVVGLIAAMVFMVAGPLLAFAPRLEATKRAALRQYGALAQRYVREFDRKWARAGQAPGEPLMGSADIQSLADLANSFDVIREMRWIPLSSRSLVQLGMIALVPLLPLTLTMFSVDELVNRLLKVVF